MQVDYIQETTWYVNLRYTSKQGSAVQLLSMLYFIQQNPSPNNVP